MNYTNRSFSLVVKRTASIGLNDRRFDSYSDQFFYYKFRHKT